MRYEVIVVGAGPAGTTLAREAARAGLQTIVLEKETFPRYKACGGAISNRTAALLDMDISGVIEDVIDTVHLTYKGGQPLTYKAPGPFTFMVMRERFDLFLLEEAIKEGCKFVSACDVAAIEIKTDEVLVKTTRGDFRGQVVVGADGVNGVVPRLAGLPGRRRVAIALESEIPVKPKFLEREHGKVHIDYGDIPEGYGWIFPKRDHLSAGIGTFARGVKDLKEHFFRFLKRKGLEVIPDAIKVHSHPIPIPDPHRPLQAHRLLLIGDAAGLADPFSGEGILYAVKSAKMALPFLFNGFTCRDFSFQRYENAVKEEIMSEFSRAKAVSRLFYMAPLLFHQAFRRNIRLLDNYFQIVAGKHTYEKLHAYLTSATEFPQQWEKNSKTRESRG